MRLISSYLTKPKSTRIVGTYWSVKHVEHTYMPHNILHTARILWYTQPDNNIHIFYYSGQEKGNHVSPHSHPTPFFHLYIILVVVSQVEPKPYQRYIGLSLNLLGMKQPRVKIMYMMPNCRRSNLIMR